MRKILAAAAIVGMSSTAALACPMSSNMSVAVDSEIVVASIATDLQPMETTEPMLLEPVDEQAGE
jgi:hypothetical protein